MAAPTSRETLLDIAKRGIDQQMSDIEGLDSKAAMVFAFSSSVLAAFAVLFTVPALKIGVNFWTLVFFVLVAVSAIAYGLVLWFLYWAVRASEWRFDPPVNVLSDNVSSGKYTDDEILLWTAEEIDRAIEANRLGVERKATSLGRALFVVVVEAACLTLAALAAFPLK